MRHPALTRFFAAFLAVVSVLTLLSGGICIKKAADTRQQQNNAITLLTSRCAEARELETELEAMREEYDAMETAHEELSESYGKEMLSYRKDLAIYTATEAGLKQGAAQIEEGYKGLRMGWIAHDNGLKAIEEAEAQFEPGYQEYLAGKAALADGWQKYYLAEEYVQSGADIESQKALIVSGAALSRALSTSMGALEDTLNHPPVDSETGEIDREALAQQLEAQSAAVLQELAQSEELRASAQTAFESVQQFISANGETLADLVAQGFSPEEVQAYISRQGAAAQAQLASAQKLLGELQNAQGNESALISELEALRDRAAAIAEGELRDSEMVAALSGMLAAERALLSDGALTLDGVGELMNMLQDLPAMKAQLEAAQAALEEGEPLLLMAKEGFAEGRKQLDAAKETLIFAEAQLIAGRKALEEKQAEQEETLASLNERKAALEENSHTLALQSEQLALYTEKKDRFSNLRYALLANDGVAEKTRAGADLIEAAEQEIDLESEARDREFSFRLIAAVLMLCAALCGVLTVAAAFRDKVGGKLLIPASLAVMLSAAAEVVSVLAQRGLIYTVLFVGLFALGVLAINLKKAS